MKDSEAATGIHYTKRSFGQTVVRDLLRSYGMKNLGIADVGGNSLPRMNCVKDDTLYVATAEKHECVRSLPLKQALAFCLNVAFPKGFRMCVCAHESF